MKVRALRGVCIGSGRHLVPPETADLDAATGQYLISIKAVEEVKDEPVKDEPKKEEIKAPPPKVESVPEKSGKKEK
jgi:hypothetical protein